MAVIRKKKNCKENRGISIGNENMEILQSDKDENWQFQENLETSIVSESNREGEISKNNRCTVQDHMKTPASNEAFAILESVKDEGWNLQDNLGHASHYRPCIYA
jgi:hypothetical protein